MGVSAEPFTVTVLGCDGGYQSPGGACSGYLLRAAGTCVLLDSGPGTLANLQRYVGIDALDAVVLSHEHPDHWGDLEGLAVARRYGLAAAAADQERARVLAPSGLREITYHCRGDAFCWDVVTDGSEERVGAFDLCFSRTDHGPETLAVRVGALGRRLVYSADTGPAWELAALGEGADLALCEATFTKEHEGSALHLSGRQAGRSARAARARRLVVSHRWPTVSQAAVTAEASEAFEGDVVAAAAGLTFEL